MLHLSEITPPEAVTIQLQARAKSELLEEFAALLVAGHPQLARVMKEREVAKLLMDREKLAATGIGNGVAIPHAASGRLRGFYGAFGRSEVGVDFGAIDGVPCRLFFALLSAGSKPKIHIKALAQISRLMGSEETRDQLLKAADRETLLSVLQAQAAHR